MSSAALEAMARRASTDPYFLGFHLAEFARLNGLDNDALAARLGCGTATLTRVRLCLAPRDATPAQFRDDVRCVAAKFGLDELALSDAAKVGRWAVKNRERSAEKPLALLAARDREAPP